MRLKDKVALITGAANGIGEATARRLAEEGARVALLDLEADRLDAVAESLTAAGARVSHYLADVRRRDQVQAAFGAVRAEWGVPDVVAHIAGIVVAHHFLKISDAEWKRVIETNLTGSFIVGQVAAQAMADNGVHGSIIFMASTNGLVAEEELADYNASKFGVVGLMKTMAVDLAPHHIRVNSVNPGLIKTRLTRSAWEDPQVVEWYTRERIPMRRLGMPEEVAACVAFLASDDASFVTGHTLVVDGGQLTI